MRLIFPLTFLVGLLLGCAHKIENSPYTKLDVLPGSLKDSYKWHICRPGAIADRELIRISVNNEPVFLMSAPMVGFNTQATIITDNPASTIEMHRADFVPLFFKRRAGGDNKDSYVLIDANTTGGIIIPTPIITFSGAKGTRIIKIVSDKEFMDACGKPNKNLYVK